MIYSEYETTYILKPDLQEDAIQAVSAKVSAVIDQFEGKLLEEDDWGKRKLAYPIDRNSRGHYVRFHYVAPAPMINELERQLRYEDKLLRFLTVRIQVDVNPAEMEVVVKPAPEEEAEAGEAPATAPATTESSEQ